MNPIKALKILIVAFTITFAWLGIDYLNKRNEKIRIESEEFIKSLDPIDEQIENKKELEQDNDTKQKTENNNLIETEKEVLTPEEEAEAEENIEILKKRFEKQNNQATSSQTVIQENVNTSESKTKIRLTPEEEAEAEENIRILKERMKNKQ